MTRHAVTCATTPFSCAQHQSTNKPDEAVPDDIRRQLVQSDIAL